jgi:short-subunit dehydrogenase
VGLDLSEERSVDRLSEATRDLDVGLVVSNAGAIHIADLLAQDRVQLRRRVQLNALTHLDIAQQFGQRLADRGRGGLLLVSSVAARQGMPGSADYGAAKAFTLVLGEGLHMELGRRGVSATVLLPGATATEMVQSYGMDVESMNRQIRPLRMMSTQQVVAEGLRALHANRPTHIAGVANRLLTSVLPRRFFVAMTASMSARVSARLAAAEAGPPS